MNHIHNQTSILENKLEQEIYSALETYSNVHRGSGYNSIRTTELYEQARDMVLDYAGLDKRKHTVIFCSPRTANIITLQLKQGSYQVLSSDVTGFSFGIRAVIATKRSLSKVIPVVTGGGTTRLISSKWVVWSKSPARFEPGTPAIINAIAFSRALKFMNTPGNGLFEVNKSREKLTEESLKQDEFSGFKGQELLDKLREAVIGKEIIVPSSQGDIKYVNLDNAASTRTFSPVWKVYRDCLQTDPDSNKEILNYSRNIISKFFGAPGSDYDIIFTSNTTEAINIAAGNLGKEPAGDIEPFVLNTILEHNSNELPWRFAKDVHLQRLDVDNDGFIDLKDLESLLQKYNEAFEHGRQRIRIVAICGASNVLGTCNDMEAVSRIVHKYGASLLVDGAQLAAHRPVSMTGTGIDYLAFSGHKTYAPFGSGALIARKSLLKFSKSEMEQIRNSGEENIAGIAALGKALQLLQRTGMEVILEDELSLTAKLLREISQVPGIRIYGIKDPGHPLFRRKAGVVAFDFKNMIAHTIAKRLAAKGGIGIRSGCHCAHMIVKHVLGVKPPFEGIQRLIVMAAPGLQLPGIARVSIGIENSEEDIDRLVKTLKEIVKRK